MAYRLPTFNLMCNIWTGPVFIFPPPGPPRLTVACQLRMYKTGFTIGRVGATANGAVSILTPARTDIRPGIGFWPIADCVECPAGSGRFYLVAVVDDVARGFANEYRMAVCLSQPRLTMPIP